MGTIMVVTIVLVLVLAIFRPALVRRGFLAVVEAPKAISGNLGKKKLPAPLPTFEEVTEEQYYDLVKRNVSDWVTDAELVATKQFDVDEAKAHKIEASYLKEACACEICLPPKTTAASMREAVEYHKQQVERVLSIPPPRFSKGGAVSRPGPTAIGQVMAFEDKAKYNYASRQRTAPMGPYADRVREAFKANQLQAVTIKADKITIAPQPPPDRTWLSYDGEDKDSYYENYGNYSVFHDMTNRTPRTGHEIGVARKLQQLKENTDRDTIRSIDGTVVATKVTQFSDEAHRILRWGGIKPFRPEGSLGYDPRLW